MRKFLQFTLVVTLAALMASCVTQKQLTYLRDAQPELADSLNKTFKVASEVIIRPGDALTIFVSALDQEAVVPYNIPTAVFATPGSNQISTTPSLQYYVVDEQGDIEYPVLGKLHVLGLKRTEAEAMIKEKLAAQVTNPMVQVNIVNARVSVLGEVAHPGQISMSNRRLTILDALAAAGDLTPYGRRDNVLITREIDGKLEIARLNLNSSEIYTSPYYYLQQNDVVYVSPNKVRAISSANASLWFSLVSTMASAATVVVTVVNVAK